MLTRPEICFKRFLRVLEETKDFTIIADQFFTPEFSFCYQYAESEDESEGEEVIGLADKTIIYKLRYLTY